VTVASRSSDRSRPAAASAVGQRADWSHWEADHRAARRSHTSRRGSAAWPRR